MLVAERTADLMMQNKILTCSQNILDSLPLPVIGIDPEGQIAQCNKLGMELFYHENGNILGTDRRDSMPEEINAFIDNVFEKGKLSAHILSNGKGINIKGVHMKYSNGQEGIILIFDKDRVIVNGN